MPTRLAVLTRIPGALMLVPLLCGALLNTVDQMHLPWVENVLRALGAAPVVDPATGTAHYELLHIGGFTSALTKGGAVTLIGAFLVCVAAQMNLRVGGCAVKKGVVIVLAKWLIGVACGRIFAAVSGEFTGVLGLSTVAIVAAMTNGNGGLYVALTGQYGDRSDVGAVGVISLNDGPFLTLLALGMLGESFPYAAFLAVLLPMAVGLALGRWHEDIRAFLHAGETLLIPFFAFALGTTLSLAVFFDRAVLAGGLVLGAATIVLTGLGGALALRLVGERNPVAAFAEASTAGNAVQTPMAVALAAAAAAAVGDMPAARAAHYQELVPRATAQISVATLVTALLCPLVVVSWARWQRRHSQRA